VTTDAGATGKVAQGGAQQGSGGPGHAHDRAAIHSDHEITSRTVPATKGSMT
jgi:hypothetical protein